MSSRPLSADIRKDLAQIQEHVERGLKLEKLTPTQIIDAVADAFLLSGKPQLASQLQELRAKWLLLNIPPEGAVH